MALPTRATRATRPIQDYAPVKRPPPPPEVTLGLVIFDDIALWCTAEMIAAGLCAGAAVCYSTMQGKPVPIKCPTLGGSRICGVIVLEGIVLRLCLLLTAALSEQLTQIDEWESEAMDQMYAIFEAMSKLCWLQFPPVLSPIGQVLSTTPEFEDCLKKAADWIKDMLITIRDAANGMRNRARSANQGPSSGNPGGNPANKPAM